MKLIINADDFGLSRETNRAIMECFERQWITNATVMVNTPGFEEAVHIAGVHAPKIGLHLNFMEGRPLTEELAKDPWFTDSSGQMTKTHVFAMLGTKGKFHLPSATRHALQLETEAQMQAYLAAGFTQMHLDSHCHSHTIDSIYRVVAPIAKKYGFRSMRKSLNYFGTKRSLPVTMYKHLFNFRLSRSFLAVDYFSSAQEYLRATAAQLSADQVCELMVHPFYESDRILDKGGCDFRDILTFAEQFEPISYSDLTER